MKISSCTVKTLIYPVITEAVQKLLSAVSYFTLQGESTSKESYCMYAYSTERWIYSSANMVHIIHYYTVGWYGQVLNCKLG